MLFDKDAKVVYARASAEGKNPTKPECQRKWGRDMAECGRPTGFTQETYKGKEREWAVLGAFGVIPNHFVIEDQIFITMIECLGCMGFSDGFAKKIPINLIEFPNDKKSLYAEQFSIGQMRRKETDDKEYKAKAQLRASNDLEEQRFKQAVAGAREEIQGMKTGSSFQI